MEAVADTEPRVDKLALARRDLALCPADHQDRPRRCFDVAFLLWESFEETGGQAALDECISMWKYVLDVLPPCHPARVVSSWSVVEALRRRFELSGDRLSLDNAIIISRNLLGELPQNHPDRGTSSSNLSVCLVTLYKQTGEGKWLDEAISFGRIGLQLQPEGHASRASFCRNCANALRLRYRQTGDIEILKEVIGLEREALQLQPLKDTSWAMTCINLAVSLMALFDHTDDNALLNEAIELDREALELLPTHHENKATVLGNLAGLLSVRFTQGGEDPDLDEAIRLGRESLTLRLPGHPRRAIACGNLAAFLGQRFNRTGDDALLDESIELQREVLTLIPIEHLDRAMAYVNLAISLEARFNRTGDRILLDEAISLGKEAQSLLPANHSQWATVSTNLLGSLTMLFKVTRDIRLLDEAISLQRDVLRSHPQPHPGRAISCINLAGLFSIYISQTGNAVLMKEAEILWAEALKLMPPGHAQRWRVLVPLAHSHISPFHGDIRVDTAVQYLGQAISSNADDLPELLSQVVHIFQHMNGVDMPDALKKQLLQSHSATIDLAILVAGFVLDPVSQLRHLETCQILGPSAYFLACSVGALDIGIVLLERTRGIVWSQSLHLRDPQLEGVPPVLASELGTLLRRLGVKSEYAPSPDPCTFPLVQTPRDVRYQQNSRVQQLIQEIRALPGMSDFMHGPTIQALLSTAVSHVVVILVPAAKESQAVIIQSTQMPMKLDCLHLQGMNQYDLEAFLLSLSAYNMRGSTPDNNAHTRLGMKASTSRTSVSFTRMLALLWEAAIKPVIMHLGLSKAKGRMRPRIHWCPTGTFTFAPLHAAGVYDGPHQECCSDYVVSSYTPTLAALLRAQQNTQAFTTRRTKLLTIAAEKTPDISLPTLWNVGDEIGEVNSIAEKAGIHLDVQDGATKTQLIASIEHANLIHLACHGIQHTSEPLKSAFCLSDGSLTVAQLMDLNLANAFLAFLSACETAKGDWDQPDQTIHLAAAMLFVGFKSVVATMWAMNDIDGPYIAKLFYEKLFETETIDADSIPYALDYAVTALRRNGVPVERWATFIHVGA